MRSCLAAASVVAWQLRKQHARKGQSTFALYFVGIQFCKGKQRSRPYLQRINLSSTPLVPLLKFILIVKACFSYCRAEVITGSVHIRSCARVRTFLLFFYFRICYSSTCVENVIISCFFSAQNIIFKGKKKGLIAPERCIRILKFSFMSCLLKPTRQTTNNRNLTYFALIMGYGNY